MLTPLPSDSYSHLKLFPLLLGWKPKILIQPTRSYERYPCLSLSFTLRSLNISHFFTPPCFCTCSCLFLKHFSLAILINFNSAFRSYINLLFTETFPNSLERIHFSFSHSCSTMFLSSIVLTLICNYNFHEYSINNCLSLHRLSNAGKVVA